MRQLRLTRIQVAAAGLAVAVGIVAILFFMFAKPALATIAKKNADAEATEQQVRTQRPQAEEALRAAQVEEVRVRKRYDDIMKNRMPDVSFEDRLAAMIRLQSFDTQELAVIESWFNSTGAEVTGYSFPTFGTDLPDPSARVLPALTWNLSVTVKDFPTFLTWLEKLPKAPRFLRLNSVNLPGMRQPGTPFTAAVSVTLYEWIKVSPASMAAAAAAAQPSAEAGGQGTGQGRGTGGRGGRRGRAREG